MRRPRTLAAALTVVALLAVGCSDDDGDASSTTTTGADGGDVTTSTESSTTGGDDAGVDDGSGEPGETDAPSVDIEPLPPVAVGEAADFGGGLFATVTKVATVDLDARAPGETAGPGILVTVELRNDTDDTVDLTGLAINATYGDGIPAVPHRSGADALTGTLAPGDRATGTYGFRVPEDQVSSVVLDVHDAASTHYVVVEVDEATR